MTPAGEVRRDEVDGDQLWDGEGRLYTRKRSRWLRAREVERLIGRGHPVALYGPDGLAVTWLDASQAGAWWQHAEGHLEVPGTTASEPDASGRTYGAHLWRSNNDVRLGIQIFC